MNRTVLAFLVAALVAGGAVGYVAGTSAGGGGGVVPIDQDPESPVFRPPAPRDDGDTASRTGALRYRDLRHALESISVPRSERGTGTITGRVLTESGEPLRGTVIRAQIRAKPNPKNRSLRAQGPPEDLDIEEYVKTQLRSYLTNLDARREAMTDGDGNYSIDGILTGENDQYYLYGFCRGYELKQNPYNRDIRAGSVVNFKAVPVFTVPCFVYLPDGSLAETASIRARKGNSTKSYSWHRDNPDVQLDPGDYQIEAYGGEENYLRSDKVSATVLDGAEQTPVEIRLKDEPGVRGKVEWPPGEGDMTVQVGLLKLEEGADENPDRLLREGSKAYVRSYRKTFLFRSIAPGTYLIGLVFNRTVVIESRKVVVDKTMMYEEFTLPAPEPDQYVLMTVTGPNGRPATDVTFRSGYRAENYNRSGSTRFQLMPDGYWRVFNYPIKKEDLKSGGTHYITVASQKYGSRTVEYAAGGAQNLTVRFDEPASLTVTVVGYRGSGFEGKIRLMVRPVQTNGQNRSSSYYGRSSSGLDADGVQKFGPLAPGDFDIVVSVKQGGYRWAPAQTVTTVLKAGENKETVSIPKLYSLTVVVDGDQQGTSFRVTSRNQGQWYSSSTLKAKDGRVVFEDLVAGDYTLQAWGGSRGTMNITIPAQSTVRFEPTVFNAQKVRVRDTNGTFVKAGLAEGDLVIGIDGEEFTNQQQMGALFTLARERKNVTLMVVRGGRRLSVVVDFTDAYNQKVSGISWEQASR